MQPELLGQQACHRLPALLQHNAEQEIPSLLCGFDMKGSVQRDFLEQAFLSSLPIGLELNAFLSFRKIIFSLADRYVHKFRSVSFSA
jgi:hypothetical protein